MKNFDGISMELFDDKVLLRLNMHILVTRYLEEGAPRFTKVIRDDKQTNKDVKEMETVSNSEKMTKKKALLKEKRDIWVLSLAVIRLSTFAFLVFELSALPSAFASVVFVPVPGSTPLSLSASAVSMPMPRSAPLSASASAVLVLVPGLAAFLSAFALFVPMLKLSAFPSTLSISDKSVPVLRLLTPPSLSGMSVPVPELSAPLSMSFMFGVSVPVLGSSAPLFLSAMSVPVP